MKSSRSDVDRRPSGLFVGLATVDVSYTVDAVPRRNQKISVKAQLITPGGPATNAAATFAFLGGRTTLVTAVGAHPLSAVIRDDLTRFIDSAARYGPGTPRAAACLCDHGRPRQRREKRCLGQRRRVLASECGVQSTMACRHLDCAAGWSVHAVMYSGGEAGASARYSSGAR